MTFPALNHVAVTVRDIDVSGPWYRQLIGAEPALDEHTDTGFRHLVWAFAQRHVVRHPPARPRRRGSSFTEFRTGLDHVGFGCADRAELENWANRLDSSASTTAGSSTRTTGPD